MKKSLFLLFSFLFPFLGSSAEHLLFSENFEKRIPGQEYSPLGRLWGKTESSLLSITNEAAGKGEKSLLIEISPGQMHGYCMSLPPFSGKKTILEYQFLADGIANFGWEFRSNSRVVLGWGFGNRGFHAYSPMKNAPKTQASFGTLDKNVWYSVKIELPEKSDKLTFLKMTLIHQKTKAKIEKELSWNPSFQKLLFCFNIPSAKHSFRIFVDEIRVFEQD